MKTVSIFNKCPVPASIPSRQWIGCDHRLTDQRPAIQRQRNVLSQLSDGFLFDEHRTEIASLRFSVVGMDFSGRNQKQGSRRSPMFDAANANPTVPANNLAQLPGTVKMSGDSISGELRPAVDSLFDRVQPLVFVEMEKQRHAQLEGEGLRALLKAYSMERLIGTTLLFVARDRKSRIPWSNNAERQSWNG